MNINLFTSKTIAILKIRVRRMKSIQNSFTQILNFLSSDNAPPETKKKIESSNKPIFINPTDSLINEDKKIKDNLKVKLDIYLIDVVNSFIDPFFEDLYERFKNSDIFEVFVIFISILTVSYFFSFRNLNVRVIMILQRK